jgi:hypothetical protein
MKELDQFTVERLQVFTDNPLDNGFTRGELMSLARIALAAKQAEPVAYLTWHQGCRSPDDCEDYLNAYTHHTEEKSCDNTAAFPVYASPVLNSPVIPDGWVACAERMPNDHEPVLTWDGMYKRVHFTMYGHWQCWDAKRITHWMPLPAAPKPEK